LCIAFSSSLFTPPSTISRAERGTFSFDQIQAQIPLKQSELAASVAKLRAEPAAENRDS
jgi:hypothetical protein